MARSYFDWLWRYFGSTVTVGSRQLLNMDTLNMQHLLSSFFLSISYNVDNFAVGIAYGVKKIKIGISGNLIIAIFSASGTYCSMSLGAVFSKFMSANLANLIGCAALVAVGIWGLWDTLKTELQKKKHKRKSSHELSYNAFIEKPERADLDNSLFIDFKESISIALALTINNLAGGIGAGLSGLDVNITTFLTFVLSLLAILLGYALGEKFTSRMSGKWAGIVSAFLIISIGVFEYFK